ncbi:ATP-grasp domain-containing protein [Actinoplanes sp. N902-109]|uniref:ATP-grasp domain-containing protein n=1 Tax=Actinoplanes sp. (strain N902-109) TaxID=649831 RepID=UPI00032B6A02|nr:ATP-grasp domain-containing protein [Actinoplanes sp. N902-109]AGL12172.2 ligase [Actinoplanes sp. N902-109]
MPQRPKLVLVGLLSKFPWVYEAAERAGIDLILVPRGDDSPEAARRARAVVELLPLDIEGDPDGALAALAERYRREPFGGIMAGNEVAVTFVARAAAQLGLTGLSEQAAAVVRDKRSMRQHLREAGLAVPGFVVVEDPDGWTDALTLRFPVVVKPANGHSSFGVIRVDDRDGLEQAVTRTWKLVESHLGGYDGLATEARVLVEEYLDGPELSAESLVHRGQVRVCAISWKGELTGPYFEETVLRAPARLPAEILAAIEAEVVGAHRAFGATAGTTHTELRLVGGVRPVVLEMAARIGGGGNMHYLTHVSSGIDLAAEAMRLYLGQEPLCWRAEPVPSGHAGCYLVPIGAGGRLKRIRGLDEVRRDPRVEYVVQTAAPGSELLSYPDWSGNPAVVLSRHGSDADTKAFHDHLARTLRVEYEDQVRADPDHIRGETP